MVANNFLTLVDEGSSFNTWTGSGHRGVRTADDSTKSRVLTPQVGGIAEGSGVDMLDGYRVIDRGGVTTIKPYLTSNGIMLLFRALFPNAAITTPMGATDARQFAFSTGAVASSRSLGMAVAREVTAGTTIVDGYTGGQVTEGRFMQDVGPLSGDGDATFAKCEFDIDFVSHPRPTSAPGSRPYPLIDSYFSEFDCTLSIGESLEDLDDQCLSKFGLKIPTGIEVDPTCIGPTMRDKQVNKPNDESITLDLAWRLKDRGFLDAWLDGTPLAFRAKWEDTSVEIEDGFSPSITIDVACFTFNGDDPVSSADAATEQSLPGIVRNNGTDPKVAVRVITSDTAY